MITKPMFPYAHHGAVITELSNDQRMDIAQRHKRCVLCGMEKPLTHERLSGGVKSYVCEDCAVKYVLDAEQLKLRFKIEEVDTVQFTRLEIDMPREEVTGFKYMLKRYMSDKKLDGASVQVTEVW